MPEEPGLGIKPRKPETCDRCGRETPVAIVSPCPKCNPQEQQA